MSNPIHKPLSDYGIAQPTGQKHMTKCPLCEQPNALAVLYLAETGYADWSCTFCSERGDNITGWENKNSIDKGYVTFSDIRDQIDDLYDNGLDKGVSTGWISLDEIFTIRRGELTVITGIPNHGKSTFLNAMLVNLMDQQSMKVAAYAPEHMPHKIHASDLMEKVVARPFWKSCGDRRIQPLDKDKAINWLDERYVWIWPKKKTITEILSTASYLIRKKKLDILVIDPWNRLEASRPGNMTETEYIGQCLSRIADFAKANNICVYIVAHPHQMKAAKYEAGEMPKEAKPNAYSLAGSAHWNDMADNIISVWRDRTIDGNDISEIHLLKVRWKMTGQVGMVPLQYHLPTGRYFVNGKAELDKPPFGKTNGTHTRSNKPGYEEGF